MLFNHHLPLRADAFAADAIAERLRQQGMTILTSDAPVKIMTAAGQAVGVRLASGRTAATDLVLLAAGVKPNIAFLAQSGIRIERGVVVDQQMRTSVPDIYAAGCRSAQAGTRCGAR